MMLNNEFYNGFGNGVLLGQLDNLAGNELVLAQYHYDSMSRPIYVIDTSGNVSTAAYDKWGRAFESTDAFGNLYRTDYDIIDRKNTSYLVAASDVTAFRANAQDSLKRNVLETFSDQWGREIAKKGYPNWPNRNATVVQEDYTYDHLGNVLTYVDPNRNTTRYQYDRLNRLTSVQDALNQTTSYSYNKLGQLQSTTQTDGTKSWVTNKTYDETGLLKTSTDPGANQDVFNRNKLGQVSVRKNPNNTSIYYLYDETGRSTMKIAGSNTIKNVYQFRKFGPSRQEEQRNGSSVITTYSDYSIYGAQRYKGTIYDGVVTVVRHEYDDQNRLKNIADAFDYFTHYKYDKTRISKVQTNGTYQVSAADNANAQYIYEPDGKIKSIIYPRLSDGSVLTTDNQYDAIGRLLKVTNKKGTSVLSQYQYSYDSNGNITSVTDASGITDYKYDKLDRLIQVKRPTGETIDYTYDARGNRKTLVEDDSLLQFARELTYTFNLWDQLKTITEGNVTTEFEYEMQGLRLYKKTTTGTTNGTGNQPVTEKVRYAYNNNGQVISEANESNQAIASYVWGPDRMLAKRDASTNQKYYYLYNGHGDVVQIVNENGTKVNSYQYDEWGNIQQQTEGIKNSFKYAGEIQDEETGLYYLRARYYDPGVGRFISKDTYEGQITNPLSQNLYSYVHNNPLKYVDPSGHRVWLIHGTNLSGAEHPEDTWTPDFVEYVEGLFNESSKKMKWTGGNSTGARSEAAKDFVTEVYEWHSKNPDDPIRLVGHSHGGNVAIMLANLLDKKGMKVDTLITIATPVRGYNLDKNTSVGQHIHVYNKKDQIQVNGGPLWALGATKGRTFKGAENVRAKDAEKPGVFSPNGGPIDSHSSMHSNKSIWDKYIKPKLKK